MLCTLLESVLAQSRFSLAKSRIDFFQLASLLLDLAEQLVIIIFVLFVVVSLLRVKIIQFGFIGKVNFLDLLLIGINFILHVALFREQAV